MLWSTLLKTTTKTSVVASPRMLWTKTQTVIPWQHSTWESERRIIETEIRENRRTQRKSLKTRISRRSGMRSRIWKRAKTHSKRPSTRLARANVNSRKTISNSGPVRKIWMRSFWAISQDFRVRIGRTWRNRESRSIMPARGSHQSAVGFFSRSFWWSSRSFPSELHINPRSHTTMPSTSETH